MLGITVKVFREQKGRELDITELGISALVLRERERRMRVGGWTIYIYMCTHAHTLHINIYRYILCTIQAR